MNGWEVAGYIGIAYGAMLFVLGFLVRNAEDGGEDYPGSKDSE